MVTDGRRLNWNQEASVYSCDLSGHFWATARRQDDDRWAYLVQDYQNNEMLSGVATDLESAQDAVESWDKAVVESGIDPSRDWPDDT